MTRSRPSGRFESLGTRNYRLFWGGQVISQLGSWLSLTATSWMVLVELDGSASHIGWLAAAQFVPTLVLGSWAGVIADRANLRRLLIYSQVAFLIQASAMAFLVSTGHIRLWMVFPLAALRGTISAFENPSRQAFVGQLVGPKLIANAVALNSAGFNSARIIGPAIAGLLIQGVGIEMCFILNAVSYLASIGAQVAIRRSDLHHREHLARAKGQIRAGFTYAMSQPILRTSLATMAIVGTIAMNFTVLVPLLARTTFASSAGMFGLFSTAMGAGSLIGSLRAAGNHEPRLAQIGTAGVALGVAMLATAAAPAAPIAMVTLFLCGACVMTFTATINSVLQLNADPEMRGRVLSFYLLLYIGTSPVGSPLVGWIADQLGTRVAFVYGGVGALAGGALAIARSASLAATPTSPPPGDVSIAQKGAVG